MKNAKEAIVLKSINFKESSKIVYLLTAEGLKSVLVRGAKKVKSKTRTLAQSISLIKYEASNRKLPTLIDGELLNGYFKIKSDFEKSAFVYNILEIVYKLNSESEDLYRYLKTILDSIENGGNPKLITLIFQMKYLYLLGINPELKKCVECGEPLVGFDIAKGGVVCKKHSTAKTIYDLEIVRGLAELYYKNDFSIEVKNLDQLSEIVNDYYLFHLDFKVKKLKLLNYFN